MSTPTDKLVTIRLPQTLIKEIAVLARTQSCAPAEVIRRALTVGLSQSARPKPVHNIVAQLLSEAESWLDLQIALRRNGLVLRLHTEDRLALHSWPHDRFMLWLSTFGTDYAGLSLQFRAPFPGATQTGTGTAVFQTQRAG